jgi:hypothetical protein
MPWFIVKHRDNFTFSTLLFGRDVGILPHYYTASQSRRKRLFGRSMVFRNVGILLQNHTASQPRRKRLDGSSKALRNVGVLPQHYTASQPRRKRLDKSSKALRNVGVLPHHYAASQPRRPRLVSLVFNFIVSHLALYGPLSKMERKFIEFRAVGPSACLVFRCRCRSTWLLTRPMQTVMANRLYRNLSRSFFILH